MGRIATTSQKAYDGSDVLPGWRSEYGLEVHIKHVVRGTERRRVVPANGISHTQIRDDKDFLAVLSPRQGGGYFLETAALIRYRPKLREPCS